MIMDNYSFVDPR